MAVEVVEGGDQILESLEEVPVGRDVVVREVGGAGSLPHQDIAEAVYFGQVSNQVGMALLQPSQLGLDLEDVSLYELLVVLQSLCLVFFLDFVCRVILLALLLPLYLGQ